VLDEAAWRRRRAMGIVRRRVRDAVRLSTDALERTAEPGSREARGDGRWYGVDRLRRADLAQPFRRTRVRRDPLSKTRRRWPHDVSGKTKVGEFSCAGDKKYEKFEVEQR